MKYTVEWQISIQGIPLSVFFGINFEEEKEALITNCKCHCVEYKCVPIFLS